MQDTNAPDAAPPDEASVRKLLRRVVDPEVGMNIVDLGLVYRVDASRERVAIDLTMTSPACPMGDMILDDVRATLAAALPDDCAIAVNLVWEPPWDPSMMDERAKAHFGWEGKQ